MAWTMVNGKIKYDEETRKRIDQLCMELKTMIEEDEKLEAAGHVFDYSFMDEWPEDDDEGSGATTVVFLKKKPKKGGTR